jgi:hypothetical protein
MYVIHEFSSSFSLGPSTRLKHFIVDVAAVLPSPEDISSVPYIAVFLNPHSMKFRAFDPQTGGILSDEQPTIEQAADEAYKNVRSTNDMDEQIENLGDPCHYPNIEASRALRALAKPDAPYDGREPQHGYVVVKLHDSLGDTIGDFEELTDAGLEGAIGSTRGLLRDLTREWGRREAAVED